MTESKPARGAVPGSPMVVDYLALMSTGRKTRRGEEGLRVPSMLSALLPGTLSLLPAGGGVGSVFAGLDVLMDRTRLVADLLSVPGLSAGQRRDALRMGLSREEAEHFRDSGWPDEETVETLAALRTDPPLIT